MREISQLGQFKVLSRRRDHSSRGS